MGKPTEQRPDDLKAAELVPDRRAPDYMRFHNRIIDLEQSVHKLMGDMDAPPQEGWGNRAMDSLSLMRAGAAGMDPSGGPASVLPADKDSIVAEIQRIRNPGGLFAPTPVSDEEFEEVLVRTTATYQQFHKLIAREVSELSLRALGHETDDQVQYQQQIIAGRISEVMREVHNLWGAWLRQEAIKNGIDILDMEAAQGLHPDHVGLMYRLAGMSDRSLATLGIELWQHESARRGLEVYPPDPEMILGIRRAG